MQIVNSPDEMQRLAFDWRAKGKKIAFVPTMGALHEGHLSLLREGRRLGAALVLSIFVNPAQFAPNEDLSKYPRTFDGDLAHARNCEVDAVFFPTEQAMYPESYQTFVDVTDVTKGLCGQSRPAHFRGVTTVVLKLFNIIQPHVSLFGEKDYQQLVTIRTMVRDLNVPVEIVGMPIVREKDGMAMSSRNVHLSKDERAAALSISRSLNVAKKLAAAGEKNAARIIKEVESTISSAKLPKIDYVKICDAETLGELSILDRPARLLIAAFFGKTRLIDNCEL